MKTSNILSLFWTYLVHCVSRNEKEGRGLDHKMSSANIEMELQQRENKLCVPFIFVIFFPWNQLSRTVFNFPYCMSSKTSKTPNAHTTQCSTHISMVHWSTTSLQGVRLEIEIYGVFLAFILHARGKRRTNYYPFVN